MPIYDSTGAQIGKIYDFDGVTRRQIARIYDNDGTTSRLIYSADVTVRNLFPNNGAYSSSWGDYGYANGTSFVTAISVTPGRRYYVYAENFLNVYLASADPPVYATFGVQLSNATGATKYLNIERSGGNGTSVAGKVIQTIDNTIQLQHRLHRYNSCAIAQSTNYMAVDITELESMLGYQLNDNTAQQMLGKFFGSKTIQL